MFVLSRYDKVCMIRLKIIFIPIVIIYFLYKYRKKRGKQRERKEGERSIKCRQGYIAKVF